MSSLILRYLVNFGIFLFLQDWNQLQLQFTADISGKETNIKKGYPTVNNEPSSYIFQNWSKNIFIA